MHHTPPRPPRQAINGAPSSDWARWAMITIDTLADPRARLSTRLRAAEQLRLVAQVAGATGELHITVRGPDDTEVRRRQGGDAA